jgi:hypothetical protein
MSKFLPTSRHTVARRFARWLVTSFEGPWSRFIVGPLAITAIPSFLVLCLTRDEFRRAVSEQLSVSPEQLGNPLAIAAVLAVYPLLARGIWEAVRHHAKPDREIAREDLLLLLTTIGDALGDKLERFTESAREALRSGACDAATAFAAITQPEQQIRTLVAGVHALFGAMDATADFRVGLLAVKNRRPHQWLHYFPAGRVPRTTPDTLSASSSTVMRSLERKGIVVVEDIAREMRKRSKDERDYVQGGTQAGEQGSQLCLPIVDTVTGEPAYVLTVAGSTAGCLRSSVAPIYEWLLQHIVVRIQREHCLRIIKENANA